MGFWRILSLSSVSLILLIAYLKRKRDSVMKYCTIEKSLRGKIVVITGASAGLGRELTYELARRGAEIVMGCRDLKKADQAINWVENRLQSCSAESKIYAENPSKLHILPLDLSSLSSVEKFACKFKEQFDKLHILVNNAGIMGGEFARSKGGVEIQFAVNHLGHFHLTNLLLDALKQSQPSRVVIVSSGYYRKSKKNDLDNVVSSEGYQPLLGYARSKLANCLHGLELSSRLKMDKVGVYVLRPGFVRGTELGRSFSRLHTSLLFPILWFFSRNVNQGVQTYLYCCLSDQEQLKSGAVYNNCDLDDDVYPDLVNNDAAERLWRQSESLIEQCLIAEKKEEK